jgi:DNA-binding response OmpR family regulator
MKKATLLVIEGRHAEIPSFAPDLQKKGFDVVSAQNGGEAISKLKQTEPIVIVNAPSLRSTGSRICLSLRKKDAKVPIILIVENDKAIDKSLADSVLVLPFTVQKLVNRIKALMPGDGNNVVSVIRSIWRIARAARARIPLTPRLITLLHLLMDKHGEVVEREALFKKVWETITLATPARWMFTFLLRRASS